MRFASSIAVLVSLTVLTSGAAHSKIKCNGAFQVTKAGEQFATPYCEDAQVANVAREFGMKVSTNSIRNNPGEKLRACQLAGYDIRIKDTCAGYRNERQGRF